MFTKPILTNYAISVFQVPPGIADISPCWCQGYNGTREYPV